MKRKIEISSLLLGAFTGAVAVLCVAAATTKTNGGASGDTAWITDPEGNHIELWEPKQK